MRSVLAVHMLENDPTSINLYASTGYAFTSTSVAVAALIEGRVDAAWARWVRPWTLAAWMFLTIGIALGSWWAYYELGWGGFWFWDPVENASFMPWLLAAALLQALRHVPCGRPRPGAGVVHHARVEVGKVVEGRLVAAKVLPTAGEDPPIG